MTAEYPKESQSPKQQPGLRPDEQAPGKVRVPDDEPDVREMTTDERMREDPRRMDIQPKGDSGTPDEDAVREMEKGG